MENFSTLFSRLKDERGLSNKQIASFTGAPIKEVKKWESGLSIPTEKRIVAALEGILGKEISVVIGNLSKDEKLEKEIQIEDSMFKVDKEKNKKINSGIFNRFRSNVAKKNQNTQTEIYTYEDISEVQLTDISEKESSVDIYEDAISERPYINDPGQLSFYFLRNLKTTLGLFIFMYLTLRGLDLFWESIKSLFNNLL
tara:strand:- start:471 stop:1064 length:594 start_codon:yes stop_codon:yes gene_type:complete